jgi:hypothetical protein
MVVVVVVASSSSTPMTMMVVTTTHETKENNNEETQPKALACGQQHCNFAGIYACFPTLLCHGEIG